MAKDAKQPTDGNRVFHASVQEYDDEEIETVSLGAVLCCFLFIVLVLLGIALIAAGGTIYTQNNNYMDVRMKALKDMIGRWDTVCEPVMKSLNKDFKVSTAFSPTRRRKYFSTESFDAEQEITPLDQKVTVSGLRARFTVPKDQTGDIFLSVVKYKSGQDPSAPYAVGDSIPLTKEDVEVPALCSCKLYKCKCNATDMCGKYMEFKGELKDCTNKKMCGTCKGRGYLNQVCLVGNFCDVAEAGLETVEVPELVGCTYPFESDNQVYSAKRPPSVDVFVYDQNSPAVMKHVIYGGASIDSPSREMEESHFQGIIMFSVGIPVFVLSVIGIIILCACQGWLCFYREETVHLEMNNLEFNEESIPMHGIDNNLKLEKKNYVPPRTTSVDI